MNYVFFIGLFLTFSYGASIVTNALIMWKHGRGRVSGSTLWLFGVGATMAITSALEIF